MDTLVICSRIPVVFTSNQEREMATKVKIELEEEVQLSTSGGGVPAKEQKEKTESEELMESDEIDDEYLSNYCETAEIIQPMTVSKELFYTDSMVTRNYARLSKEDQKRFDQMKELTESIKQEDLMARVVGERFGSMKKEDVSAVLGRPGKGSEGGKHLKQEGGHLTIKSEPGAEPEKIVISAIVPAEKPTLLPNCVKGNEEDCETISSVSDLEEIDKVEVQNVLKELADLKRREAECIDKLVAAVPEMRDSEVVVVTEKVRGPELLQCVYEMSQRISHPRDFCAALPAGEKLYSLYKFDQAGTPPISIPELCNYYDVGKMKIYELLCGEKYKYPTKEETEKKPVCRIRPQKVEEEPPEKRSKKTKATTTT